MHNSYKKWLDEGKPKIYCTCGCGQEIVVKERYKYDSVGISRYLPKHFCGNIPWNKGLNMETDERVRKNVQSLIKYGHDRIGISMFNAGSIKKGQHLSPETEFTTEKLLGHETSKETRKKLSEWQKGDKAFWFGKVGPHKNYKHSEETKNEISKKLKGKYSGKKSWSYGRRTRGCWSRCSYYNSPLQGKIYLRSSYELKFAKYLDKNNIPWLYEIQTFDLGNSTYTPDFFLPTSNLFVEIKGYMTDKAKNKINEFLDNYHEETLQILYRKDLIKLGVL